MDDLDYFLKRQREEEAAAASAPNEEVASVHAELAERYALVVTAYEALGPKED